MSSNLKIKRICAWSVKNLSLKRHQQHIVQIMGQRILQNDKAR